jgi:hypothetical protein
VQGTESLRPYVTNNEALFDGIDDYISHPTIFDSPSHSLGLSVSTWIKPTSTNVGYVFYKLNKNAEDRTALYYQNTTLSGLWEQNNDGFHSIAATNVISTGTYTHVGMSWGTAGFSLVVNGLVTSNAPAATNVMATGTSVDFEMGGFDLESSYYEGYQKRFRAFNRQLTDAEWLEVYHEDD